MKITYLIISCIVRKTERLFFSTFWNQQVFFGTLCLIILTGLSNHAVAQWSLGPRLQTGPTIYSNDSESKAGLHLGGGISLFYKGKAPVEMEFFSTVNIETLGLRKFDERYFALSQRTGLGVNFYLPLPNLPNSGLKLGTGLLHNYLYYGLAEGDYVLTGNNRDYRIELDNLVVRNSFGGYMQLGGTRQLADRMKFHLTFIASGFALPEYDFGEKQPLPGVSLLLAATLAFALGNIGGNEQ